MANIDTTINLINNQMSIQTNAAGRGRRGTSLATQQSIEVEIVLILSAVLCALM